MLDKRVNAYFFEVQQYSFMKNLKKLASIYCDAILHAMQQVKQGLCYTKLNLIAAYISLNFKFIM